jgi:peptide deformylase
MILPIIAYGNPILRKKAGEIDPGFPGLPELIADMWETMYASKGVGLAAPQVNKPVRLFLVDSIQLLKNMEVEEREHYKNDQGIRQVFINARISACTGDDFMYNEGCLSIPKIREDIERPSEVAISYLDESFVQHTRHFKGVTARIVQHEYDHIEGKLFIDYLKPLKKRLLKNKLDDISKGKITVDYKMVFPKA